MKTNKQKVKLNQTWQKQNYLVQRGEQVMEQSKAQDGLNRDLLDIWKELYVIADVFSCIHLHWLDTNVISRLKILPIVLFYSQVLLCLSS